MPEVNPHIHEHTIILSTAEHDICWCHKCGKVDHIQIFENGTSLHAKYEVGGPKPIQKFKETDGE